MKKFELTIIQKRKIYDHCRRYYEKSLADDEYYCQGGCGALIDAVQSTLTEQQQNKLDQLDDDEGQFAEFYLFEPIEHYAYWCEKETEGMKIRATIFAFCVMMCQPPKKKRNART